MSKKAKLEYVCPSCKEKLTLTADEKDVKDGKVSLSEKCPRCLNQFEAVSEMDCLEWDDQCNLETGRLG